MDGIARAALGGTLLPSLALWEIVCLSACLSNLDVPYNPSSACALFFYRLVSRHRTSRAVVV